jgi:CRP-like cAMP-binding protein
VRRERRSRIFACGGYLVAIEIKDIPFFHDLSPAHLGAVRKCLTEKSFKKGDVIHNEGDSCSRIFFVRAGRIKVGRTSSAGKEQIFEVLGPGDTCACNPTSLNWSCPSSAEAAEDSQVWFLSRESYIKMVNENSTLMHALNALFAKRLQCFANIIEEVAMKDTKKRLIKFLLDMLKD